jgi:predicted NBD/HSP70 family sugar kinase
LLRRLNAQRVLDAVRESGPMRVTELVALTGLSRPTVDAVADDLVRLGWLSESAATAKRGRPARSLAFRADAGYVAGVDIGEVKVRTAVADLSGEIVAERLVEFEQEDRLPVIRLVARATLADAGITREQLVAACVGCTGPMDPRTGHVLFSSIFPDDYDLAGALAGTFGRRPVVENDCNLAVIAERWRTGLDDIVAVLAGERIGAGIMVGGQIMRGHAGAAGELAFVGVDEPSQAVGPLVRALAGEPPEVVFPAAEAGDDQALEIVAQVERSLSTGIVMTAQLVNPEVVVISGGAARAGEVLLAPLRARVDAMVRMPPRVEASPLAERGPLLGAIHCALDDLEPRLLDALDEAA